jgi:mannose-6-phosphate isomerase-like protein (cupin superfamily)
MTVRRVITTTDDGRSRVLVDEQVEPARLVSEPGMEFSWIWGTPAVGATPADADLDPRPPFFPTGHGTSAVVVSYPPAGPDEPWAKPSTEVLAALREDAEAHLPGLFDALDHEDPSGFHATLTLDYMVVLSGTLDMELDDDVIRLEPGTCVVQQGTRHRWVNRSGDRVTVLFVMIGATSA